eukprot:8061995-Pyramimonas_sp.AAC.1
MALAQVPVPHTTGGGITHSTVVRVRDGTTRRRAGLPTTTRNGSRPSSPVRRSTRLRLTVLTGGLVSHAAFEQGQDNNPSMECP